MKPTFILLNENYPFVLSVPPVNMRIESQQKTISINLIDFGEVVKIGERNCDRISFSSFFPNVNSPFYKVLLNPLPPVSCVQEMKQWKAAKAKIRLLVPEFNISYDCYIESFNTSYEERTGDIQFEMTLCDHRSPKVLDEKLGIWLR